MTTTQPSTQRTDNPSGMQFGIFTVGDLTRDPVTGRMPS